MGVKVLQVNFVDRLETLRKKFPHAGIVLLSGYYDLRGIKRLRAFAKEASSGYAYLFKHSVDTMEQLAQVIRAVAQGLIILDPQIMWGVIESGGSKSVAFLMELTQRELEVLNWMAKGYQDRVIAKILCLEPRMLERHIYSIYGKLGPASRSKHPRVNAIMLYLKATGQLPSDGMVEG